MDLASKSAAIEDVISREASCKGALSDKTLSQVVDTVVSSLRAYRAKDDALTNSTASSTIKFPYQVDNSHYYVFTLQERTRYSGKLSTGTMTWKCGLEDILTLSLGVMGTTVSYRTYSSQSVPNGSSTQNILVVNGKSGWTPQGLALLNYKLYVFDHGPQPGTSDFNGTGVEVWGNATGLQFRMVCRYIAVVLVSPFRLCAGI